MITALRRSLGSLPCSQKQTRSSWSLLCNAGPPSFQISGGIPLTSIALLLLNCSMALVISSAEGSPSTSALTGCWGMLRIAGSWMTQHWRGLGSTQIKGSGWRPCLWKAPVHPHWARDSGPGELGYTLLWGLHRSLCSHLGLHIAEFSLRGWSTTHLWVVS